MALRPPTFISANKNSPRSWAHYAQTVDYGIAQYGLTRSGTAKGLTLLNITNYSKLRYRDFCLQGIAIRFVEIQRWCLCFFNG